MTSPSATATLVLDVAERAAQAVGYSGLSFRDLAAAVGIKSASVHYHFPTKERLGAALARRYTDRLMAHLASVAGPEIDASQALSSYVEVFRTVLRQDGRMCLCGMLAAETDAVPDGVRKEVRRFVDLNVDWIAGVLARAEGKSAPDTAVRDRALATFAALEGAMLIARGTGSMASFDAMVRQLEQNGLLVG